MSADLLVVKIDLYGGSWGRNGLPPVGLSSGSCTISVIFETTGGYCVIILEVAKLIESCTTGNGFSRSRTFHTKDSVDWCGRLHN